MFFGNVHRYYSYIFIGTYSVVTWKTQSDKVRNAQQYEKKFLIKIALHIQPVLVFQKIQKYHTQHINRRLCIICSLLAWKIDLCVVKCKLFWEDAFKYTGIRSLTMSKLKTIECFNRKQLMKWVKRKQNKCKQIQPNRIYCMAPYTEHRT